MEPHLPQASVLAGGDYGGEEAFWQPRVLAAHSSLRAGNQCPFECLTRRYYFQSASCAVPFVCVFSVSKQVVQSLVEHYMVKCKDKGLDRDSVRDDLMNQFDMLDDFLLDRSKLSVC